MGFNGRDCDRHKGKLSGPRCSLQSIALLTLKNRFGRVGLVNCFPSIQVSANAPYKGVYRD